MARHDSWILIKNFEDHTDHATGKKSSQLMQVADFGAFIDERWTGSFRHPQSTFDWAVSRQRTEREGRDDRGSHWAHNLATGSEPTMAKAKSAAARKMRELRAAHIAAGGDVGYGDAPTGDQIRAQMQGAKTHA